MPEAGARATLRAMPSYIDPRSGRTYPLETPRWCGDDGAPLLVSDLPGIGRDEIAGGIRSIWRYAAALPFLPARPVTMGEGCTPLVEHEVGGTTALLKCEWFMPTGSFKDRGASVMLSLLREQGIGAVLEDSSGNGGAAISAYAAAGGMAATIFVPASTSPAKTVQSRAVGAAITLVPGSRQDCADAAEAKAKEIFYASHNWQAFFLQGTKTLAYELWEDLNFTAPDNVIVPCGAGSNVLGLHIGFSELLRAGQLRKLPRIFAAQPENCAPIARAALGLDPVEARPTIAEGTAISKPLRTAECLRAMRESGGGAVMLTEAEIAAAALGLAKRGVYVEPTSAQAAAAVPKLIAAGKIAARETTVAVLTGTGIKATPRYAEMLGVEI